MLKCVNIRSFDMKTIRLLVAVMIFAVAAFAQRVPQCDPGWKLKPDGGCERETANQTANPPKDTAAQPVATSAPALTDVWTIQQRAESVTAKDAFETSGQYATRLAAAFQLPETLHIAIGKMGVSLRYDADKEVLSVRLKHRSASIVNTLPEAPGSIDFLRDNNPLKPDQYIEVDSKIKSSREYTASNAYGREAVVHETFSVGVGIPLYGSRWKPDYSTLHSYNSDAWEAAQEIECFRLNMDPARAREAVEHLHVVVTAVPRPSPFLRASFSKTATIDSPTSYLDLTYLLPVEMAEVLLVDDRTSSVVASLPMRPPARQASATQTAPQQLNAPVNYQEKIGITFDTWLALNSINLDELSLSNHGAWNRLKGIQKSGKGEFYTTDQYGHTVGWKFKGGLVIEVKQ